MQSSFVDGPCLDPLQTAQVLQNTTSDDLDRSECSHSSADRLLTCRLGLKLNLEKYALEQINVLVLFVQRISQETVTSRVLDLCFIQQLRSSVRELAICGYQPVANQNSNYSDLPIVDIPALAVVASPIRTLLIQNVHLWQSVELRQFKSLKHLLILQGQDSIPMKYYHTPHCADCEGAHPSAMFSFHYLIPLSSQLTYFLFDSSYGFTSCSYDLLKEIQKRRSTIATFVVASNAFYHDLAKPVCQTCKSGLCPLLSVCLDQNSNDRRNTNEPFECLCVEELRTEDEFVSCKPMTIHQPMYSTRCNHTPSFWNYVTSTMIIVTSYIVFSIIVFILSTVFLMKSSHM